VAVWSSRRHEGEKHSRETMGEQRGLEIDDKKDLEVNNNKQTVLLMMTDNKN
jgi:hypothetical protein